MIKLTKEQILKLHNLLLAKTGGSEGIRDEGLLDSAINAPFQTYNNEELYPSTQKKAARLCFNLIKNHAFIDGNKRVGIMSMLVFLEVNGITIKCSDNDLIKIGIGVADGSIDEEYILNWIIKNS